jgi:glyoxylase-like metal-dependent hydrolase (beta-lactamase superfamily II)
VTASWTTQIGAMQVQRVEEMLTPGFFPAFLFPDYDPAVLEENPELAAPAFYHAASGRLMSSMQSWLLRTADHVVVIDTGCGNDKVRENEEFRRFHKLNQPYLDRLAACGVRPEDVTMVVNTHLHVDHVGWNTRLMDNKWVPTFPRARYLMGRTEYEHWSTIKDRPDMTNILADSVTPIMEAGLATMVETNERICDEITLIPTLGHTPGHVSVMIQSQGEQALITGDFMHHPCQIAHPEWSTLADSDPDQGIETRRRMFQRLAGTPVLIIGTHFAGATAGRLVTDGDSYRLDV